MVGAAGCKLSRAAEFDLPCAESLARRLNGRFAILSQATFKPKWRIGDLDIASSHQRPQIDGRIRNRFAGRNKDLSGLTAQRTIDAVSFKLTC